MGRIYTNESFCYIGMLQEFISSFWNHINLYKFISRPREFICYKVISINFSFILTPHIPLHEPIETIKEIEKDTKIKMVGPVGAIVCIRTVKSFIGYIFLDMWFEYKGSIYRVKRWFQIQNNSLELG
jgi:hypothetical protein